MNTWNGTSRFTHVEIPSVPYGDKAGWGSSNACVCGGSTHKRGRMSRPRQFIMCSASSVWL